MTVDIWVVLALAFVLAFRMGMSFERQRRKWRKQRDRGTAIEAECR